MKKQIWAMTILGVGVMTMWSMAVAKASAQEASAPPAASQGKMNGHHQDPFADLNLSDDQKAQIKKIHEAAHAKAEAVKADSSLSDADKEAKLKGIHHETMMEAEKVLTPEQLAKWKAERKEHRAEKSDKPS